MECQCPGDVRFGVTRGPAEVGPPMSLLVTTLLSPYLFTIFAGSWKEHLVLSTQQTEFE